MQRFFFFFFFFDAMVHRRRSEVALLSDLTLVSLFNVLRNAEIVSYSILAIRDDCF